MNHDDPTYVVVTHDGKHHADDVLACWAFTVLLPGCRILRSSNRHDWEAADVLLDCGGRYDPDNERYDHHGKARLPERHGQPFATAGLVWLHYGREICHRILERHDSDKWLRFVEVRGAAGIEEVVDLTSSVIEREVVNPVDAWDNGRFPSRGTSYQFLPMQWLLPHLSFDEALAAFGRAITFKVQNLADGLAETVALEEALEAGGPHEFFVFDEDKAVVVAADNQRVELVAAKTVVEQELGLKLGAVLSSLRRGSRWAAFMTDPVDHGLRVPDCIEFQPNRRNFFCHDKRRLLGFVRKCLERDKESDCQRPSLS